MHNRLYNCSSNPLQRSKITVSGMVQDRFFPFLLPSQCSSFCPSSSSAVFRRYHRSSLSFLICFPANLASTPTISTPRRYRSYTLPTGFKSMFLSWSTIYGSWRENGLMWLDIWRRLNRVCLFKGSWFGELQGDLIYLLMRGMSRREWRQRSKTMREHRGKEVEFVDSLEHMESISRHVTTIRTLQTPRTIFEQTWIKVLFQQRKTTITYQYEYNYGIPQIPLI